MFDLEILSPDGFLVGAGFGQAVEQFLVTKNFIGGGLFLLDGLGRGGDTNQLHVDIIKFCLPIIELTDFRRANKCEVHWPEE